ncbi:glutaredoxin [Suhomyces tanzawaensis NRRL Y-17324]|uniref:Glutaredoxin n=1 Tax=Suhomyces tanzawaensis NRRL Y-17324 TaxID=984487 RepID=A0A1E4SS14_9ASCO|nr:glutaredoxin [Suhomyces tanzawaensis NRRL Y-17324]ODV82285.1 glutaredoxin [Suhomyces tanzawaensis NRRL Y-17324]
MFSYIASWFKSPEVSAELLASVKASTGAHKVVVYSKSTCPYCYSTKQLLKQLNQDAHIVELNQTADGASIQAALAEITGQRTVPNVFINGKHIGGNSDLQELHKQNKLVPLLQ